MALTSIVSESRTQFLIFIFFCLSICVIQNDTTVTAGFPFSPKTCFASSTSYLNNSEFERA